MRRVSGCSTGRPSLVEVLVCDGLCELVTLLVMPFCLLRTSRDLGVQDRDVRPWLIRFRGLPSRVRQRPSAAPTTTTRLPPTGYPALFIVPPGTLRVQVVVLAAVRLRTLHLDPLVTGSRMQPADQPAEEERIAHLSRPPSS